jgi:hypothetical protein
MKPILESPLDRALTMALVLDRGCREVLKESGSAQDIVP